MRTLNILIICSSVIFSSCCIQKKSSGSTSNISNKEIVMNNLPELVIYKTTKDYTINVPVIMNAERTKIVSYPAPSDLLFEGKPTLPSILKNGYLLDNRGINENVVFLNYTYEDYNKLTESPSMSEMLANILDKYPLKEIWYCGKHLTNSLKLSDLNKIIDSNFEGCKKVDFVPMNINLDD